MNIAPSSGMNSTMSLTKTSDEEGEGDDDDFGDTISLLEGKEPRAQSGREAKTAGTPCNSNMPYIYSFL